VSERGIKLGKALAASLDDLERLTTTIRQTECGGAMTEHLEKLAALSVRTAALSTALAENLKP
jgi:hypothetical protein